VVESLCDAMDLRAGETVLDVGTGDGTVSLVAGRRGCDVTSATAEALPFVEGAFDAVVSSFGVMCTPRHRTTVRALLRLCRPTGRLGVAVWAPGGFMCRLSTVTSRHAAPGPTEASAAHRDLEDRLESWLRPAVWNLHTSYRDVVFRCGSVERCLDILETCDGPVRDLCERLPWEVRHRLERDVLHLIEEFNVATAPGVLVPSRYVEVVALKK
jgi:SAM-dependent methyltransferase